MYPKTMTDHGIVDLYHRARMPQANPVTPFDTGTTERIESLYHQMETRPDE